MDYAGEDPFTFALLDCVLDILPGGVEYQHVLGDIEEKLKENSRCMEECLASLRSEVNEKAPSAMLMNTTECLQWLNNYHITSRRLPETAHCDVICFLRTLQSFLKNNENQEELILHLLSDLASQCGITFGSSLSESSLHCTSQTSLHAVDDNSSMEIQTVWDDIRLQLRRYLVAKLQDNFNTNNLEITIKVKSQYLHHLLFLYPVSDVLLKYQNIQHNRIAGHLQNNSGRNLENTLKVYQDAIPKVYSMIKEDLFILSHVVDSSLIIKFINETFFDSIKEEMKTFFEILGEANIEQQTLHQKHNKRKHKQRVHVLVPDAEDHLRKKDKHLNLNQLKYLSRFIKLFMWLEDKVGKSSSEILYFSNVAEMKRNIQGISNSECSEIKLKETHVLDEDSLLLKEMPTLKFGWKNTLKALSDSLLHCLPTEVEAFSIQILQRENEEYSSTSGSLISLVSIDKSNEFYGAIPEEQKPKKIAKFCFDIIEVFDGLLPLALACKGDTLKEIKACFVESFSKVATLILTRLEELVEEVPSKAPVMTMFTALSTAIHVLHHFTHYNSQLSEKPLFLAAVLRYQEFISNLQIQVTNYSVNICATSILQDAESHHWDDNKAFYEGERCSFSIQMWHYFCCGLRYDLWTVLPPDEAQKIFKEVLEQTLALLTFRYSQVHPNYKRASQIRIDVMAILSCVENFLWSVCSSLEEFVRPAELSTDAIVKIHNHCNILLSIMGILTAPLKTLHEISKNAFTGLSSNPSETAPEDLLQWLIYIKPNLFTTLDKTPSAGKMAVQGQLKLLLSQPCCNWNLLLETLLHPDCLIARTLLSCSLSEKIETSNDDLLQGEKESSKDLTDVILTIFSCCSMSHKSFTVLLEQHMDQAGLWDSLCSHPEHTYGNPLPPVIRYLHKILMRSVVGIVKQATSHILSSEPTDHSASCLHKYNVPESLIKALPEKWNFTPRETELKKTHKGITRLTSEAVSLVISKLPSIIACLPLPIKYFYAFSEKKISEQYSKQKDFGILLWNLIGVICYLLEDGNTIEHLICSTLSRWSKERLAVICECLKMTAGKMNISDSNNITQRVLENIEKPRPKWIEHQLQKAKVLSMEGCSTLQEDGSVLKDQGSSFELAEQKINMMVLNICHKPGGSEYLRQIYHIIQLNEKRLNEVLSVQDSDMASELSGAFQITWNSTEETLPPFNPLHVFTLPNPDLLVQTTSAEWSCDWSALLPLCLRMNPLPFNVLLEHRNKDVLVVIGSQGHNSRGSLRVLIDPFVEEAQGKAIASRIKMPKQMLDINSQCCSRLNAGPGALQQDTSIFLGC
ncbi:uncharacterized protein KIAA0825 homolog [Pelodytes ibericus]